MQQSTNPDKIRGRIEKVYYAGPKFSAGRLLNEQEEEIQFAGNLFARENQPVALLGKWINHPKYGRQFKVETMQHDLELNKDGLVHYLANHPDIKGIGPVKARRIVDKFGDNFEETLIKEPEKIAKVANLKKEAISRLQEEWLRNRNVNAVLAWLSAFELTHNQVTTLVDRLGDSCLAILKEDPYVLVRELHGFGFKKVDQIARKLGTDKDHPARIKAGLDYCVREALGNGHCWVEYEELLHKTNLLLVMDCLDSRERIDRLLKMMLNQNQLACASHGGRFLVAIPEIMAMENDLAKVFMAGDSPNPAFVGNDFEKLINNNPKPLNKKQFEAIEMVLSNSISLISGGAGSGKTYTVSIINYIYNDMGLKIVLAAPTGKAARRLEEVSDTSGTTIHRLLGYDGKNFTHNRHNPIKADLLVVDESSMIDVSLAWHLFEAIDLTTTAVVLVGDHNQLPPVGPGNILRDLIQSHAIPMVILDKVVRQAGVLKENSTAILRGELRKTSEPNSDRCRDWYLADKFTKVEDAGHFLLDIYANKLTSLGFDLLKDVQVLTPTHKGPLGTKALNLELQKLIQKKLWETKVPEVPAGRKPPFLKHDKIIQTRNNYDLGIMNGTIGHIMEVMSNGDLLVNFEGMSVEIKKGSPNLQDLQLAYALTVHKVQGSEFPCAIIMIHKAHSFMHHRNLLYTGVTRAKKTTIIIGDHWGIRNCVKRCQVDSRSTFLSHLLSEAGNACVKEAF